MKVKKGQKLRVYSGRKQNYDAIAKSDFDTIKDEWYDVVLDQETVSGINTDWFKGEGVPCRKGIDKIRLR